MELDTRHDRSVDERRGDERRLWRVAYVVSIGFHLLLIFLWTTPRVHRSPFAAAGPRSGDAVAAAGGLQSINMRVPPTRPITPPPIPLPTVDVEPVEFEDEVVVDEVAAVLGDAPGLEGPGVEDGTGQGDGGTAEEGFFQMVPAVPRSMIMPPEDDRLKGKSIEVWVFVDARGRVIPDSTYLRPTTGHRNLDQRLIREASEWLFNPARKGGEVIAAWTKWDFIVGGRP